MISFYRLGHHKNCLRNAIQERTGMGSMDSGIFVTQGSCVGVPQLAIQPSNTRLRQAGVKEAEQMLPRPR